MRSSGWVTVYPRGPGSPRVAVNGALEVQRHPPQALRETPTSPQKVRSGRRLGHIWGGGGFISIPSGRTLLKVAQWCSLALAFLTGPVHLPWSKEEELEAWRGGTAARDAHRTEQGWTTTRHFTIRKGLSTLRDLHNSWPAADNTAFHTSNTKLIRGWIIVLCATEKENIGN